MFLVALVVLELEAIASIRRVALVNLVEMVALVQLEEVASTRRVALSQVLL